MLYSKEILVKDYFEIHNFYSNLYGKDKTIILMQVGSFHEAYCTDAKGLNLVNLAQELDVVCTKKNGNKELSDSNPRMMGFPIHVTHNFIEKLIQMNYTVVLIDQTTEPPNPKREITGIYSPGTYLDKSVQSTKSNNLVSIVIDKVKSKTKEELLYIGFASYDLSTGSGYINETYSTNSDNLLALDDGLRFLETIPPREVLLLNKLDGSICNMSIDEILQYLQVDEKIIFKIKLNDQQKIKYQEKILEQIFPQKNQINIFQNLNIEKFTSARLALTILLEYTLAHQSNLLNNIKKPEIFDNNKYLYLGNRALEQLDVLPKNSLEKGLLNIINYTKTNLGKRFLLDSLTKPLYDSDEINLRYTNIEILLNNEYYKSIDMYLEDIYDIEKLNRKIDIGNLHPYELYQLYLSFYQIGKLTQYMADNKITGFFDDELMKTKIQTFINHINGCYNITILNQINFINYFESDKSFYNKKMHKDIDELVDKIEVCSNFISLLKNEFENILSDDKSIFSKSDNSLLTSKFNDRDGYYLLITNRRCKILKERLKNKEVINIGNYILKLSDLQFNELPKSSNTKISCDKIKEISNELVINKQKLANLNKIKFKEDLINLTKDFSQFFNYWAYKIGYLDFINSGAKCSIINKYTRPIIDTHENSFFIATEMRHPIIENINKEYKYVPHNIGLGGPNKLDGILLYGINSSGKSTLMKSIGLNIILAQIGYFVSCKEFKYKPYKSLFTRIVGNDNLYKGLSSFMVEMMELTAILKRNNNNTLVIGDEICRGTEEKSANIIVSYMLKILSNSKSSFITATHLHKVANLPCIKDLTRVKSKHLKITYDPINDQLIYDRHLSDGQGETFYGLQVAKFLMKDKNFNEVTNNILLEYESFDKIKKSNYNDEYMLKCEICSKTKNLESHHIIPQREFDKNDKHNYNIHIRKNSGYNLVTLCSECHDKIDTNELVINGWIETTNGRKLDYLIQNKVKNNKYSDDIIAFIKQSKNLNDPKIVRIKIKEQFNRKISTKTISSFWDE